MVGWLVGWFDISHVDKVNTDSIESMVFSRDYIVNVISWTNVFFMLHHSNICFMLHDVIANRRGVLDATLMKVRRLADEELRAELAATTLEATAAAAPSQTAAALGLGMLRRGDRCYWPA